MNLYSLVNEVKADMDKVGVPYKASVPFFINKRTTKVLGSCHYIYVNHIKVADKIEISKNFMDTCAIQDVKNTICHELIHSAFPYAGHGGEWKYYANLMTTSMPEYTISRLSSAKKIKEPTSGYKITCNKCGFTSYYRSRTKAIKILTGEIKGHLTCPECDCCDDFTLTKL